MDSSRSVQTWATAISTNATNGRKIIFRFAKDFSPSFDIASQPERIILVWKYDSDTGQPVSEEHRRMNLLEDFLEPAIAPESFATLALVSTGENLREWIYYASSSDEFIERLNSAFEGLPPFPIEIHTADDPTWSNYHEFKSQLVQTSW